MDPEKFTLTPEEQNAEKEALADVQDDKLRSDLVASLGLEDNDQNKAVIDSVFTREKENRTKLSKAIGQKIDWRTKALAPKPAVPATTPQALNADDIRKQTEETVTARLEQRDLDDMEYPDDIKEQIKSIAKVKSVSIRKAEKDPYIQHLIAQAVAAGKIDEATPSRTPRSAPAQKQGETPKFDMSTPEGRKDFDEWKKNKAK